MSFIPLLKLRFAAPEHVIDVGRLSDLRGISESDGWLRLGATTTHGDIEHDDRSGPGTRPWRRPRPQISDPIVRNWGTIGGSLAHADPAGDWGSVMLALGGQVVATSSSGERTIDVDDLLVSTFTTVLEPNEILTEVRVPVPDGPTGGAYLKLERKVGDFATVAAAVHLTLDDGHISGRRDRPHGGRAPQRPGHGGRGVPGRGRADRGGLRRGRPACRRGRRADRRTSGGAPSTSGTSSRCTSGAAWPAPSSWPRREGNRHERDGHRQRRRAIRRRRAAAPARPPTCGRCWG